MDIQLIRPVKKPYIVTFSYANHLEYARQHPDIKYNGGIDYVSTFNDETGNNQIYPAYIGTVCKVGYDESGYGNYVKIEHTWGYSLYAHMKEHFPLVNDVVSIDTPIGYIGHTGMCFDANGENTEAASHVHFECRDLNNVVFNPTEYIIDRTQSGFSNESEDIKVGSIVYIKNGATAYNGAELWSGVYGSPYRVDEIYNDRVVLDYNGICTPVNIKDIAMYTEDTYKEQKATVSSNTEEPIYYTVKDGDTMWGIAYNNNMTLDALMVLNNNISNASVIQVGQQIRIK